MGEWTTGPLVKALAWTLFAVISGANVWLVGTAVLG